MVYISIDPGSNNVWGSVVQFFFGYLCILQIIISKPMNLLLVTLLLALHKLLRMPGSPDGYAANVAVS